MLQIFQLYVFILAGFVGFITIQRVPPLLHTPLMSATNAISGISLVGSLVAAGGNFNKVSTILGAVAVTCATINTVGGFLITDRMLRMFRRRDDRPASPSATAAGTSAGPSGSAGAASPDGQADTKAAP